jgi:hypothetical protein
LPTCVLKYRDPYKFMGEVIQSTGQEFWRSPTVLDPPVEAVLPAQVQYTNEACGECGTEFMIGAGFCHTCGLRRPAGNAVGGDPAAMAGMWTRNLSLVRSRAAWVAASLRKVSFPTWLRYLHFHEIQHSVGLPTAALIAFIIGLGCVVGALAVSLFYKASNLAEFQAIQMWRIEWLVAATSSFVAGILLKKTHND